MSDQKSEPAGGFKTLDGIPADVPNTVPAGVVVRNPGTGETGKADGYGGVFKDKK